MLLNCGVGGRLLRVPWTARRPKQSILKEISPEYSLEGLMLKLKLQHLGHLMQRTDSLEKTLMLGKTEGRRRRNNRGWDGWIASLTQWTWVWASSRMWWWTGKPGVLQSRVSQRVRHDWATELNWHVSKFAQNPKILNKNREYGPLLKYNCIRTSPMGGSGLDWTTGKCPVRILRALEEGVLWVVPRQVKVKSDSGAGCQVLENDTLNSCHTSFNINVTKHWQEPQQLTAAPEPGLRRVCIFLSEKGCDPVDSYSRVPQPRCLWHWGRADSSLCVAITYVIGYWAAPLAFTQQTPGVSVPLWALNMPPDTTDVLGRPITCSCKPPGQSLGHGTHFWPLLMVVQRGSSPFTNVIRNKGLNASVILT